MNPENLDVFLVVAISWIFAKVSDENDHRGG